MQLSDRATSDAASPRTWSSASGGYVRLSPLSDWLPDWSQPRPGPFVPDRKPSNPYNPGAPEIWAQKAPRCSSGIAVICPNCRRTPGASVNSDRTSSELLAVIHLHNMPASHRRRPVPRRSRKNTPPGSKCRVPAATVSDWGAEIPSNRLSAIDVPTPEGASIAQEAQPAVAADTCSPAEAVREQGVGVGPRFYLQPATTIDVQSNPRYP